MAKSQIITEEDKHLVNESELQTKLDESHEENKRLLSLLEKTKASFESSIKTLEDRIGQLEKESDQLKGELEDKDRVQTDYDIPSQKEIYLQIVAAIAPAVTLGTEKLNDDTVRKVAAHAIGVSQIFHKATKEKFHYK